MLRRIALLALCVVALTWSDAVRAQQAEPRIALVIGNAAYGSGALPTALNDAGLVAETLRSIGFEIVEGADLNQPDMLRVFREFLGKIEAAGPDALAFVYFAGNAISFDGENYLLGVGARLARESDIPLEGLRLSDLLRPLADAGALAKVVIIDAARPMQVNLQGGQLAPGLEAMEAPQSMLIAMSSAPGTVMPDGPGPYGAYATAIAEMLRAPGIDLDTAFTQIRSRTHLSTEGNQTPWHVANLGQQIVLVPADAATAETPPPPPLRAARPMRALGPDEGYALAIESDSLDRYVEYVDAYPDGPYSERVWAMIRARREALVWMRAVRMNTAQAYWTYRQRYPGGLYFFDSERRLRRLSAPLVPPAGFAMVAFAGLPLALRGEPHEYRPIYRVGPPPPRLLMRPPPAFLVSLPPPRRGAGGLPLLSAPIPGVPHFDPAHRRPPLGAVTPGGQTFQPGRRPGAIGVFPPQGGAPANANVKPPVPGGGPPAIGNKTLPPQQGGRVVNRPSGQPLQGSTGNKQLQGQQGGSGARTQQPAAIARPTPPTAPPPKPVVRPVVTPQQSQITNPQQNLRGGARAGGPPAGAKPPACPAGKTLRVVNGHPVCA